MASVEELKAKTAEAMRLFDRLRARQALAQRAGLTSEYSGVVSRFARVKDALQKLTDTGSLTDAVKVIWNGSASVNGLGIVPLVAWAGASVAIAGAVSVVGYWLTEAYALDRRLDAYEQGLNAGKTPKEAADAAAEAAGDNSPAAQRGWGFNVSGLTLPALVVATVLLGPRLVEAWQGRKG